MKEERIHVNLAQVTSADPDLLGANICRAHKGESIRGVLIDLVPVLAVIGAINSYKVTFSSSATVLSIVAINCVEVEVDLVGEELGSPGGTAIN
jgi:hypothetical protein